MYFAETVDARYDRTIALPRFTAPAVAQETAIEFPFTGPNPGTGVEIYHGAHGAFETKAPVRTFVPRRRSVKPRVSPLTTTGIETGRPVAMLISRIVP
jgi:hypothetical protein